MEYTTTVPSPLGQLTLSSDGTNLTGLWIEGQKYFGITLNSPIGKPNLPIFEQTKAWLDIYFSGKRPDFMPSLAPHGSEFRKSVWHILSEIPYGTMVTYGQIATQLNTIQGRKTTSARAVGGAVGHNPISIIIPCHRVVGANGNLTGYAGGLERKLELLKLEKITTQLI